MKSVVVFVPRYIYDWLEIAPIPLRLLQGYDPESKIKPIKGISAYYVKSEIKSEYPKSEIKSEGGGGNPHYIMWVSPSGEEVEGREGLIRWLSSKLPEDCESFRLCIEELIERKHKKER